jgi:hypothetical protein
MTVFRICLNKELRISLYKDIKEARSAGNYPLIVQSEDDIYHCRTFSDEDLLYIINSLSKVSLSIPGERRSMCSRIFELLNNHAAANNYARVPRSSFNGEVFDTDFMEYDGEDDEEYIDEDKQKMENEMTEEKKKRVRPSRAKAANADKPKAEKVAKPKAEKVAKPKAAKPKAAAERLRAERIPASQIINVLPQEMTPYRAGSIQRQRFEILQTNSGKTYAEIIEAGAISWTVRDAIDKGYAVLG